MKLTIQLVTWNAAKYLPLCLDSIFNQTYRDFQVLVIDNNSLDNSVDFIKKNFPQVTVFTNHQNNYYAKAHNQGFKLLKTEYVLVTNPDIILEPDFLAKLMAAAESHPQHAVFSGKLLRLIWQDAELGISQKTNLIDTVGIRASRKRHFEERGAGEEDVGQYDKACEVFAISGALVLYRREALERVKMVLSNGHSEYFDENFVINKEDIDICWRLHRAGWSSLVIPEAVAYHFRTSKKNFSYSWRGLKELIRERKARKFGNYFSYKNHLLLLLKNETLATFTADWLPILIYELKKFFYLLFFETKTLACLPALIKQLGPTLKKRKMIYTTVSPKELRKKWFK
ncbi:MAG: glycosyltransferase family 2 protein [Candidatus Buchananbacteria bacterium]